MTELPDPAAGEAVAAPTPGVDASAAGDPELAALVSRPGDPELAALVRPVRPAATAEAATAKVEPPLEAQSAAAGEAVAEAAAAEDDASEPVEGPGAPIAPEAELPVAAAVVDQPEEALATPVVRRRRPLALRFGLAFLFGLALVVGIGAGALYA